ncbi:MAG: hypothetical protein ACK42E_03695, partial [Candidatus Bipolaricaulaceae bacterium]
MGTRRSYGRVIPRLEPPDLIAHQLQSYERFLREGIPQAFAEVSPIRAPGREDLYLELVDPGLGEPRYDEWECRDRDLTYAAPLRATGRLWVERKLRQEAELYLADIPLMTPRGTFIINGTENVIVSELVRSPGLYITQDEPHLFRAHFLPEQGAWLEIELDTRRWSLKVRLDRRATVPVTTYLRALGMETAEILSRYSQEAPVETLEEILSRTASDCSTGAVFLDPRGRLSGTIFFSEATVVDGNAEIAGKRVFAVLVSPDGRMEAVPPAILYDLLPGEGKVPWQPPAPTTVQAFVARHLLPSFRDEVSKERQRQAEIRRRYGLKSLESLIFEAEHALLELEIRRNRGEEIPQVTFDQARRRREELEQRKKVLMERIQRETYLSFGEIRVLGVAAVLPASAEEELAPDPEVERIGMEVVLAYERRQGRDPRDVSQENLGYDVRS